MFIVAAVLTPPDPISQLALAHAHRAALRASIFAVKLAEKQRTPRDARAQARRQAGLKPAGKRLARAASRHLPDTKTLLAIALVWAVAAYLIVPKLWVRHFRRHPFLTSRRALTETGDGHPGDPINIGLVGDEAELVRAMTAAGWYPGRTRSPWPAACASPPTPCSAAPTTMRR